MSVALYSPAGRVPKTRSGQARPPLPSFPGLSGQPGRLRRPPRQRQQKASNCDAMLASDKHAACLVLALIVGQGKENRPAIAARRLAIRAAEQPNEILMLGTIIRPEAIDKRLNVEPGRLEAH